jgi:hypothetical protein
VGTGTNFYPQPLCWRADNCSTRLEPDPLSSLRVATFYQHHSFVSSLKPFKVKDALYDPDWMVTIQEEMNNSKHNKVWSLVERPKLNVVGTKKVFHNKQDKHRVVTRNKARLIAKGYSQVKDLDFDETFAPVARL